MDVCERVRSELFLMRDADYAAFTAKLIPNIAKERIIGVRMPQLRAYAKRLASEQDAEAFLACLPHRYQEENLLHGMLLCQSSEPFDAVLPKIEQFLPEIDNWAVCDALSPRAFDIDPAKTYAFCLGCLESPRPYTVRFGVVTLLYRFLEEGFDPAIFSKLAVLPTEEYYVNMAVAWYLSQALALQYEATLPAIESDMFCRFVHNKAIQKAIESFRVPEEHKTHLRTLRRRTKREEKTK